MLNEVSGVAGFNDWPIFCRHYGQDDNGGNSKPRQYASHRLVEVKQSPQRLFSFAAVPWGKLGVGVRPQYQFAASSAIGIDLILRGPVAKSGEMGVMAVVVTPTPKLTCLPSP